MNEQQSQDASQGYRFLFSLIAVAVIFLIAFNLLSDWLNEAHNVNPAMVNIANVVIPVAMVFCSGVYLMLFRRGGGRGILGLCLSTLPIGLFGFLQPVFNGDAKIVDWQYRFSAESEKSRWPSAIEQPVATGETQLDVGEFAERALPESGVDLITTTPFDFPRFLGANADATITNVNLLPWSDGLKPLWKQPIGKGWSGFSIVNGFAVTQEQRADQECVTCYEVERGQEVWCYRVKRRHEDTMGMGKPGPRATPTIHQGLVYAMSATGVLDCLDGGTGRKIWSADIPDIVGIGQKQSTNSAGLKYTEEKSSMAWGRSTSPVIYQDKVIVPGGTLPRAHREFQPNLAASLIAFNRLTGELIWKGGKRMVAYGSPTVRNVLGHDQVLLVAEDHVVGHDPETGEELWAFSRPGGSGSAANCSQVTWLDEARLLFSKGYAAGGETVKLDHDQASGVWGVTSIKKDPRVLKTKMTSPVVYGDHLFALSDGYLECVEVEGLKRKWKRRQRFGNGQLLLVGDKLVIQSEFGTLHLVEANPEEFVLLASTDSVEGICWNTICLHRDLLLVRSDKEAACFRLPIAE